MENQVEKKKFETKKVVVLSEPIKWDGGTIKEICLDVSSVTGKKIVEAQNRYKQNSVDIPRSIENDFDYLGIMGEMLSGIEKEAIESLTYIEYMEVIRNTQYFLIFGNLVPEDSQEN